MFCFVSLTEMADVGNMEMLARRLADEIENYAQKRSDELKKEIENHEATSRKKELEEERERLDILLDRKRYQAANASQTSD